MISSVNANNITQECRNEKEEIDATYYMVPVEVYDKDDCSEDYNNLECPSEYEQIDEHTFALSAEITEDDNCSSDLDENLTKLHHEILSIIGKIPLAGSWADITNAGIYLAEGDLEKSKMAMLSSIPIVGDIDLGEYSEETHNILDVAGFFPAFGAIPDALNALIYLKEGDYTNMSLSAVAAIPAYGDAVKGASMVAKHGGKITDVGSKSLKLAPSSNKISGAWIKRFSTDELKPLAEKVVREAKTYGANRIGIVWTNGTKYNAKAFVKAVEEIAPDFNVVIHQLENQALGVRMEKWVNRQLVEIAKKAGQSTNDIIYHLKNGTLWKMVFSQWPKEAGYKGIDIAKLEQKLMKFQRRVSRQYAGDIKKSDFVIRFKEEGRALGQSSVAEAKAMSKAKPNVDLTIELKPGQQLTRSQYIHRND